MRRKGKDRGHDDRERWLLTYADMITLLMAFFIMMYSMSVLNLTKFKNAAISIRSGFGGVLKGQGQSVLGSSGKFAAKPSPIQGDTAGVSWKVIKPLVDYTRNDESAKKTVSLGEDERGLIITLLSDRTLFGTGRAEVRPRAYPILDRVAELLGKTSNRIQVEGHTCNLPLRGSRYRNNLELSVARAMNVLNYLEREKGLPSNRFSVAGYGSTRPIRPNDSEENRRGNRRVEIVLVRRESIEGPQPPSPDVNSDRRVPEIRKRSER